jgi:hypothetical protein
MPRRQAGMLASDGGVSDGTTTGRTTGRRTTAAAVVAADASFADVATRATLNIDPPSSRMPSASLRRSEPCLTSRCDTMSPPFTIDPACWRCPGSRSGADPGVNVPQTAAAGIAAVHNFSGGEIDVAGQASSMR